jgi:hypothetical protein
MTSESEKNASAPGGRVRYYAPRVLRVPLTRMRAELAVRVGLTPEWMTRIQEWRIQQTNSIFSQEEIFGESVVMPRETTTRKNKFYYNQTTLARRHKSKSYVDVKRG